jgi:hypothetical protein
MIYVDKVAGLVGVKAYVSPGLITAVVKVFAVIAAANRWSRH